MLAQLPEVVVVSRNLGDLENGNMQVVEREDNSEQNSRTMAELIFPQPISCEPDSSPHTGSTGGNGGSGVAPRDMNKNRSQRIKIMSNPIEWKKAKRVFCRTT